MARSPKTRKPGDPDALVKLLLELPARVRDDVEWLIAEYQAAQMQTPAPGGDIRPELDEMCEEALDVLMIARRLTRASHSQSRRSTTCAAQVLRFPTCQSATATKHPGLSSICR
jgi:hypothetical protein